ncbi:hypothetical protein Leryth_010380 [Lithospermum erythrorhizon]|nr:hypothetical protein Leryth_010380 [Lithospermum erythrorhizon]
MGDSIMTKEIILRNASSSSSDKKQPLLHDQDFSSRGTPQPTTTTTSCSCGTKLAEVVGGTTADCAAVCCCCPCGLVNLIVLAVYKLPAGLYRKALRKKRRRKMIKNGVVLPPPVRSDEPELIFRSSSTPLAMVNAAINDKDVLALEEEMWGRFYSSGFWRSPSQRSEVM